MINDVSRTPLDKQTLLVKEFMERFGQEVPIKQDISNTEYLLERIKWLREEVDELEESVLKNNKMGVLDALADIEYIHKGTVLATGFAYVFGEAFDEVHRSNMTKSCATKEEAEETKKSYEETKPGETFSVKRVGNYFLVERGDGKVQKSIKYSRPKLIKFIE